MGVRGILWTWIAVGAVVWSGHAWAAEGAASAEDLHFFEQQVRPLLVARCYECHGPETQEKEFRLDRYQDLMRGGASGTAIVPGKPTESLLIAAIGYKNEDLRMPPDTKMPEAEIKVLEEWVRRGAPHPDAGKVPAPKAHKPDIESGRSFWAFQPPVSPPVPTPASAGRVANPIDRFWLAKLEEKGLPSSPRAEPRLWLRRVTLDLIGLPPTPEELQAFLADTSPNARETVVDRLLGSPRYGERWGRHWLDVVRYSDSNGSDENVAHGNAWRYRDYVIGAFNRDKPFDQFVREQLAGDLLPAEQMELRRERLIATGFLSLGAKVLAEVDEQKMELDIVDEQIETLGRVFLGLTMGCVRCHDHKTDPLLQEDYYALAGIFQSTKTMENFKKVAKWNEVEIATEEELAARAEHQKVTDIKKGELERILAAGREALVSSGGTTADSATLPAAELEAKFPESVRQQLKTLRDELKQLEKNTPKISSAMGVAEAPPVKSAVCLRGSHLTRGKVIDRGVPAVLVSQPVVVPDAESGRRQLVDWLTDRRHPLVARVFVNRIWRWHFGRGLVESTDNFGQLGDRPTHPELLDWLAVWFMEHDWSVKELQRLIVGCELYGQASHPSVAALPGQQSPSTLDPDNRWLWRFPVRRMEAEAIRDSMLAVAGDLDLAMGGSLLHVGNREYLFDHTSKDGTKYDSRRRTVYLPVVRNNLYDLYQLFDGTDATLPSGDRATSTVATQALFMLNSPLVADTAKGLARVSWNAAPEIGSRAAWLYERALGRPPMDGEVRRVAEFVERFPSGAGGDAGCPPAWLAVCQMVLASNEFVYVR